MIDTHTHIYLEEFDEDRIEVVRRAREAGVERVILPNVDFDTVQAMHATNDLFPGYCRMAMGLHPTSVEADYRERLGQVRELLFSGEYCAVGEIGLDLYWDKTYAEEQKEAFVMQTGWAAESGLPVIIHCREAFDEILLETDAPYLAPVPYRGKRNEPSYLPYMAKRIAEILDITTVEVEEATTANAVRLFGEG